MTYWNNNGTHQSKANELQELVPVMGKCDTLRGEIWRAATKIYYDFYNNGFGNHWVEPAMFLMDMVDLDDEIEMVLYEHADGNCLSHYCDYEDLMESMIDTVIEAIHGMDDAPNEVDMWSYASGRRGKFSPNMYDEEY